MLKWSKVPFRDVPHTPVSFKFSRGISFSRNGHSPSGGHLAVFADILYFPCATLSPTSVCGDVLNIILNLSWEYPGVILGLS